jgi:alpha-N-arabinofuranosidase
MVWDEDGWPVVNGGKSVTATMTVEGTGNSMGLQNWRDDFAGPGYHPRWSWVRNPDMANYQTGDGITLKGCGHTLSDGTHPTALITRQNHLDLRYRTRVQVSGSSIAGLTVFHTNEHHYDLCVQVRDNGLDVWLRRRAADMFMDSKPLFFENTNELTLQVEADKLMYVFSAGTGDENMVQIGTGSSQLLSTEVMRCTFTGCFAGIFAEGDAVAKFDYFSTDYLK